MLPLNTFQLVSKYLFSPFGLFLEFQWTLVKREKKGKRNCKTGTFSVYRQLDKTLPKENSQVKTDIRLTNNR